MFPRSNLVNIQDRLKQAQATHNMQLGEVYTIPNVGGQIIPTSQPFHSSVVDSSVAIQLSMGNPLPVEKALMERNDIWHRIIIQNGAGIDKETALKAILRTVSPADLIPVKYQVIGTDSCFLVRNCGQALDKLCKTSLIIQTEDSHMILTITLGFASIHDLKINIQPILLTGLVKRYALDKKLLNLEEFHKDADIYKQVYCPLSQSKTLGHVLRLAKSTFALLENLNLKSNEISSLSALEPAHMKTVKYLDLRHNDLIRIECLEPLKCLNILELWLDGNPLCENYSHPQQYVEAVREYCPNLLKLDGVTLNSPGLPLIFKSYIKNWQKRKLVEQFVEHFFTAYDSPDRTVLKGLYHENAWCSTTVGTPTSLSSKKCLEPFGQENRNLLIFGKNSQQLLHYGSETIIEALKSMPASQHFHKSFCSDLIFDSDEVVVITVEGLFKLANGINQILAFNRTFVLAHEEENEFKIRNDQYHVFMPSGGMDNISSNITNENPLKFQPNCFSSREKEDMIISFQEATSMKSDHCEKFLKYADWDMRKAITIFLHHYKNGSVPKDAFYTSMA
ncbi:nuclear RNA export factor 2-like [Trichogramma pretiosum]|uniref:nuclear RNA export factor 2-like n=1 Tax=Trichogramma pretiosum TaxID=7493 RepID=UPI0006C9A071|nr:nuclear RNA export factor 2-like [Trichogramma pretiosum]XP_014230191.1 nuclear RNA export factor 2-like [Trichogramma pretiosum]